MWVSFFCLVHSIQKTRKIKRKLTVCNLYVYIYIYLKTVTAATFDAFFLLLLPTISGHLRFNFLQSNQSICELTTHFKRRILIYLLIVANRLFVMPNMAKSSFNQRQWESLDDDKWVRNRWSEHISLSHICIYSK